jgi:hypothetical protein
MNVTEALVADFASDPIPYDKVLKIFNDPASPWHSELSQFLASLPPEVIEEAYADSTFVEMYGKNENYARAWFTERLLIDEAARRRLKRSIDCVNNWLRRLRLCTEFAAGKRTSKRECRCHRRSGGKALRQVCRVSRGDAISR